MPRPLAFQFPSALALPLDQNIALNSSANITPHFHVGPRTYNDAGIVPHPLELTGAFTNNPAPDNRTSQAGQSGNAPGGVYASIAWPHYFAINGQEPG